MNVGHNHVGFCQRLTPLIIFATKSLGFSDPSPGFEGMVGTEEDLTLGRFGPGRDTWQLRPRQLQPRSPRLIRCGIISGESIESLGGERGNGEGNAEDEGG
jgi:hypothetical protein